MKIGILTFHRALNYGAVLQCYALQEVLKTMGHEVEVIDYRPNYIERHRDVRGEYNLKQTKGIMAKLKVRVALYLSYISICRANKVFDNFITRHYSISSYPFTAIEDMPQDYDIYVLGSDQIWNPNICDGYSRIFWGQFKRKPKSKLVAYAASLGITSIPDKDKKYLETCLRSFDYISVREDSLKYILKDINIKDSISVLDPTLLASIDIFEKIVVKPEIDNYVLLVTLEKDADAYSFAQKIARQLNCKVVRLSALSNIVTTFWEDSIKKIAVSPEEYCGLFRFATCTVCISFHATAFSLMFKKDFYVLESKKKDRAYNLLLYLGLERRMVSSKSVIRFSPVDYANYDELMRRKRENSMEYLRKAIQ